MSAPIPARADGAAFLSDTGKPTGARHRVGLLTNFVAAGQCPVRIRGGRTHNKNNESAPGLIATKRPCDRTWVAPMMLVLSLPRAIRHVGICGHRANRSRST